LSSTDKSQQAKGTAKLHTNGMSQVRNSYP
jgi:hypothetical protein